MGAMSDWSTIGAISYRDLSYTRIRLDVAYMHLIPSFPHGLSANQRESDGYRADG